jgi:Rod binding domain-containing protein
MQIFPIFGPESPQTLPKPDRGPDVLMEKARELEAAFLAEMLAHAGLGSMPDGGFGGGIGEEQFASFLRQEQAEQMVRHGGIGLAEHLFRAMTQGSPQ